MDQQSNLTLFNAIATAGKAIYEIAQGTSKLEQKQELMEVYDTLMSLKREAGDLEDENRELKAQLRFRSDDLSSRIPSGLTKRTLTELFALSVSRSRSLRQWPSDMTTEPPNTVVAYPVIRQLK